MKNAPARILAEFLGTFAIVLISAAAVMNGSDLTGAALAAGISVFIGISAFAAISGSHFNPAVTIALAATKRVPILDAIDYIFTQLIAAAAAAAVLKSAFGTVGGYTKLGDGVMTNTGIMVEGIATFILMITILGVFTNAKGEVAIQQGFPIGMAVAAGIYFAGPLTGAAMNPARWFGPAIVGGEVSGAIVWIVGPILGALAAIFIYDIALKPGIYSDKD